MIIQYDRKEVRIIGSKLKYSKYSPSEINQNPDIKKVDGFDNYFVSRFGDIYSIHQSHGVDKVCELTPKNPGNDAKYLNIIFSVDGKHYTRSVHRLVAQAFVPGYFEGAVVNHKDGNNRNNDASNLEWVTQRENIRKSYDTSGMDQTRNYKWWTLFSPDGTVLGTFKGNIEMCSYIKERNLDVSTSSLVKYGQCNGYYVEKSYK